MGLTCVRRELYGGFLQSIRLTECEGLSDQLNYPKTIQKTPLHVLKFMLFFPTFKL
jgi:hypothetical protein